MVLKRFEDYKRQIILAYKKKRNQDNLPPNLRRHTPEKIENGMFGCVH